MGKYTEGINNGNETNEVGLSEWPMSFTANQKVNCGIQACRKHCALNQNHLQQINLDTMQNCRGKCAVVRKTVKVMWYIKLLHYKTLLFKFVGSAVVFFFIFYFISKFDPAEFTLGALCQKERVRESFVLNVLSSAESHTHSVCQCVVVGSLQPTQQPFKQHQLVGGLRGLTGKLAAQGIQGTLTPALTHSHAFIPLFTLDHWLHSLSLASLNLPFWDVISPLSALSLSFLPNLTFFFFQLSLSIPIEPEHHSLKQSIFFKYILPYLYDSTCD